jgi:hypothetical protein
MDMIVFRGNYRAMPVSQNSVLPVLAAKIVIRYFKNWIISNHN